ncbi:uncharacterized protein LOC127111536 [Lathyrus oleraceus]|uniref:uncharacterized protein LOC127111536 n=1 Tax=Pisum sativum TaxID=3888 RepID=UPI0021CF9B39|nr:uncharacterized protein LOC127111536 [Pisum sativum]
MMMDVKPNEVKGDVKPNARLVVVEVGVHEQFTNKQKFIVREYMLQWICMEVGKLGFRNVIGRPNNDSDRIQEFVTNRCERSDMYQPSIRKIKHDDTRLRKLECLFKLQGYCMANDTWKFNVVSGIHNHALCHKITDYPIVCRFIQEENKLVSDMTLNMVSPKSILENLKLKRLQNVSNIKQVYNLCARNNKVSHSDSIKLFNTFPTVLIIDPTYMTNTYRLPLLEIVGVTSTEKTF